ncbi:Hydroxymethylglutaryl-CoA synthase, partial [Glycine soja]
EVVCASSINENLNMVVFNEARDSQAIRAVGDGGLGSKSCRHSSSSITNRNKDGVHLWPREYFSSQLKHNPFSLRIANSSGERRLKGMVVVAGLAGDKVKSNSTGLVTTGGDTHGGRLYDELGEFQTEDRRPSSILSSLVSSLLEKYAIDPKQIGRLELLNTIFIYLSETRRNMEIPILRALIQLMHAMEELLPCSIVSIGLRAAHGMDAIDFLSALTVYAEGPARHTGGAAAVAMLIGPNAPIAFESKLRGSQWLMPMIFTSLILPVNIHNHCNFLLVVDGKLSQTCYLMALDSCYNHLSHKYDIQEGMQFSISDAEYFVFHSPYDKVFYDFLKNPSFVDEAAKEKLKPFATLSGDEPGSRKDLRASQQLAKPQYDAKDGKRVILFSYGSGLTSTMFSLQLREGQHPFSLSNIAKVMFLAN